MEPWGNDAWRNRQLQLGQKLMERLADRSRMNAASFCEGEQRRAWLALLTVTLFYVTPHTLGQLGPEWHDATLAELGFADEQPPYSHNLNHGRLQENAAAAIQKRFFRAPRNKWTFTSKSRRLDLPEKRTTEYNI